MEKELSDRARALMALAEKEAERLGHPCVGTEHIWLGLLGLDRTLCADVLTRLGVDPAAARAETEQALGTRPEDKPFMYTDISERELIKWMLGYTMDWIIETFEAIPDDAMCVRPRPNINAPAWIFGHIVVTERFHVGGVLEGVNDIPEEFRVFRARKPTEEQIRAAFKSKAWLVDYWRDVRAKTEAYLDRITDADLKEVPGDETVLPDGDPNRGNPRREWFVMTIQHQNCHWGELRVIEKLLKE